MGAAWFVQLCTAYLGLSQKSAIIGYAPPLRASALVGAHSPASWSSLASFCNSFCMRPSNTINASVYVTKHAYVASGCRESVLVATKTVSGIITLPIIWCTFLQQYRIHMDIGNSKNYLGIIGCITIGCITKGCIIDYILWCAPWAWVAHIEELPRTRHQLHMSMHCLDRFRVPCNRKQAINSRVIGKAKPIGRRQEPDAVRPVNI